MACVCVFISSTLRVHRRLEHERKDGCRIWRKPGEIGGDQSRLRPAFRGRETSYEGGSSEVGSLLVLRPDPAATNKRQHPPLHPVPGQSLAECHPSHAITFNLGAVCWCYPVPNYGAVPRLCNTSCNGLSMMADGWQRAHLFWTMRKSESSYR